MLAVVCPGQGAQSPGMLTPWLAIPDVDELLTEVDPTGHLRQHGTVSDADTIRDTAIAQPLMVTMAALSWQALHAADTPTPDLTAGHSVGEFSASIIAGVLSAATAVDLVTRRGAAMATAAAKVPTGMSAVLGGDPTEVVARITELGLTPANRNGGGQIVAAGALPALAELAAAPPAKAKVMPLQVAGAFHTDYMASGQREFAHAVTTENPAASDPTITLLSNANGQPVRTGQAVLDALIAQITLPVRWDLCMETMATSSITGVLELAPAGVLTGLARRALRGIETFALKTPDQLDDARAFMTRHAHSQPEGDDKEVSA